MSPDPLVAIVTTDFAGVTRGRSVPARRLDQVLPAGVGWLPANLSLTPFDGIATPNPWGSQGDLRLRPDPGARYHTSATGSATPFDMIVADIIDLDGGSWRGCARSLLREATRSLRELHGLRLRVSFEQEFQIVDADLPAAHSLSLAALRGVDPLGPMLMTALEAAGVEPEVMLAEFGRDQFEVTCAPADPLTAADRAVAIREIVRETARTLGWRASFSPKTAADAVGNGVHIHLSLWSDEGRPLTRAAETASGLSAAAQAFFAGILRHLPALTALTAPSPISYLRLRPHSWSAAYSWLADRDREAALRICPTWSVGGGDPDRQCNVEYRAADATANPYLALYGIVRAGLTGLARDARLPALDPRHPSGLADHERAGAGIARLPETLDIALEALRDDAEAASWLAPDVLETYLGVRKAELARVAGLEPDAACSLYKALY